MSMSETSTPTPGDGEDGFLVQWLVLLGEQKWLFLVVLVLGCGLSVMAALRAPRLYTASTVVLPPQQQQNAAANTLAQLGALAGMAGAGVVKAPDELYVSLLKTRRLQDALIERFKLQSHYGRTSMSDTRWALSRNVGIAAERKTGLITINVDDPDARFAADLANAHFEELRKILSNLAVTEAQQRRAFYELQVNKGREALADAEIEFRKAQAEGGMVVSQSLADAGVRGGVELRAQIAAKEVQLAAVSRFATPSSPESQRLAAELSAMRQQVLKLEQGGGFSTATPTQGMKAVQAFRNMKIQEASLDALIRLYEVARVDEARDGPLLQQVDKALAPEMFSKPSRSGMAMRGGLLSLLAAVSIASGLGWWRRLGNGSAAHPAWQRLKRAWLP